MDVLDAEYVELHHVEHGLRRGGGGPDRRSRRRRRSRDRNLQSAHLFHLYQHGRLLEPAHASELRIARLVPEKQPQCDGGRQLHAYADAGGAQGDRRKRLSGQRRNRRRRAQRRQPSELRFPRRAGQQHLRERRFHPFVARCLQHREKLVGRQRFR